MIHICVEENPSVAGNVNKAHPEGMTPGERLKKARTSAGMTQHELAVKSGLRVTQISRWENGKTRPRPESAHLMEDALGVARGHILSGVTGKATRALHPDVERWFNEDPYAKMATEREKKAFAEWVDFRNPLGPHVYLVALQAVREELAKDDAEG